MPSSLSNFQFDIVLSAAIDTCEQARRLDKLHGIPNEADQRTTWDTGMLRITLTASVLLQPVMMYYV